MADVSAKTAARRLRKASTATFIQRSRGVSSEEKALYHNVLGAGRSGVIRQFFDVNEAEQDELARRLAVLVGARIERVTP